jgi:dTDP-4-amino-4,6-dideoxygalactose transaminase
MTRSPRLFLSPPDMSGSELGYVEEVFASNYIAPAGPMLARFEKAFVEYTRIPHAVSLSSGTAAIHLALKSLDAQPGDEVWAATLTFIGGVAPIVYERLVPVFLDSDPATWTLDPRVLEEELTLAARRGRLPAAVITTDLFGQSCDLDPILETCDRHGVPVISDSAEAVGARYRHRHAGDGAYATAFSFNGNKIITTSGGGILASHDASVVERARYFSEQARQSLPHYEHVEVGFNYRMSNVLAAIGLGQLGVLDKRIARRRRIFDLYCEYLGNIQGLSFMPEADFGHSTRWLTVIEIDPAVLGTNREIVRLALEAENIEARPVWQPMHMQPVFAKARRFGGAVAEGIYARGLCLPSGSSMSDGDVVRVASVVRRVVADALK